MGAIDSISYVVVGAICIFCFHQYYLAVGGNPLHFPFGTFAVLALNSLLGVISEFTNEDVGSLSQTMEFIQSVVPLSFLTCEYYLKNGIMQKEIALAIGISGAFPAVLYVTDKNVKNTLVDAVQLISAAALAYGAILQKNYFALGSAILFSLAYFNCKKHDNCFGMNCRDMFNYAIAGFAFCALQAIK